MKIACIKYNAGNIYSVVHALRRLGVEPVVSDKAEDILSADKVIFPGVGEASTTMNYLKAGNLDKLIVSLKQPVLGICLGMQLMCSYSEEGGHTGCLGIFDVPVKLFRPGQGEKIPHMGWNSLCIKKDSGILAGLANRNRHERLWRIAFIAGIVAAPWLYSLFFPLPDIDYGDRSWALLILAGLAVGFGSRLGSGCTSGHGVCGLSRLSVRSLAATTLFIVFGALTVFIVRHLAGG